MFKATFLIKLYLPNKKFFLSFLDFEQNLFGLLTRKFCALFSQLQLRVHSNVFIRNIFFKKGIFSKTSSVFLRSFFMFWSENLRQSWQKCTFYVRRTFQGKKTVWKKLTLLNIYGFWATCFWDLAWSFNRVAKFSQFVLEDFFEQKHCFQKKFNYRTFFELRAKNFRPDF